MGRLFKEQSQPWQTLAQDHLHRIDAVCADFVRVAISHVVAEDVSKPLQEAKLDVALKIRYNNACEELSRLIADKQRHPITYDPSYTTNVEEARTRKTTAKFPAMINQATVDGAVNPGDLEEGTQSR